MWRKAVACGRTLVSPMWSTHPVCHVGTLADAWSGVNHNSRPGRPAAKTAGLTPRHLMGRQQDCLPYGFGHSAAPSGMAVLASECGVRTLRAMSALLPTLGRGVNHDSRPGRPAAKTAGPTFGLTPTPLYGSQLLDWLVC